MTIWRIKDGIPSLADSALVPGGCIGAVYLFDAIFTPTLDYFEPRGLLYLGHAILFVVAFGFLGLGFFVFARNQAKIRPEIRVPRIAVAVCVPPLFFLFHTLALSWLFPLVLRSEITLNEANHLVQLTLMIGFSVGYFGMVWSALRWPARTAAIMLWFPVSLGALGLAAKILKLFMPK